MQKQMNKWMIDQNHLLGFFSVITYYNGKKNDKEATVLSTRYVLIVQRTRGKMNIQMHFLSLWSLRTNWETYNYMLWRCGVISGMTDLIMLWEDIEAAFLEALQHTNH